MLSNGTLFPADTTITFGVIAIQTRRFVDLVVGALRPMQACLEALGLVGLPCAFVEVDEATEYNLRVCVVYAPYLLISSQCSLIPLQRFLILSLFVEYECHIVDCSESIWMVYP